MVPVWGRDVDAAESDIQALPALAFGLPIPGDDEGETGETVDCPEGKRSDKVRAVAAGTVMAKSDAVEMGVSVETELELDLVELVVLEAIMLLVKEVGVVGVALELGEADEASGFDDPPSLIGLGVSDAKLELDDFAAIDEEVAEDACEVDDEAEDAIPELDD